MQTTSSLRGISTSHSEVSAICAIGFWLIVDDKEFFVPFADYPVFKQAAVDQVFGFIQLSPTQFHWPQLDVDIELDALAHPERYPLKWA